MHNKIKDKTLHYRLEENGEFVIENYNFSKPFANFLPGIAGKYGIPMWVFYVNRAQAISSFGIKDKDHAIVEFFPANKSWQLVSSQGFRTFIKLSLKNKAIFYEPFQNGFSNLDFNLINKMSISSWGLKIEETNLTLGLELAIEYFTIPNDSYAALARIVTIKNTGRGNKRIQLLDGLPQIVPFGTSNLFLKKLGRTIEAWMQVDNLEKGVPFYKLDVDPIDRPEVIHIKEGNFYLGFHYEKNTAKIIKPIVDPQTIFGPVTDFSCPRQFLAAKNFVYPKQQAISSKTPCCFLPLDIVLKEKEEKSFFCLCGYMGSLEKLNSSLKKITASGYLTKKTNENRKIIEELQQNIATTSSSKEFDFYAKQTYLDNIIRGGEPIVFSRSPLKVSNGIPPKAGNSGRGQVVFYLYSRKHGDLERDYNKFQIQPTYFSQGNGNYRDMNQNRRCNVWFNPDIKEDDIVTFFNLLQTDGFNPLVIKGAYFTLEEKNKLEAIIKDLVKAESTADLRNFLHNPFTPGEVILFLEKNKIKLKTSCDEFLNILLSYSKKHQEAEHGEGFWTDHWVYNLDLLESYFAIYPEDLRALLFDNKNFGFYDNAEIVRPRREKYLLHEGKPKQLHAVVADEAKKGMIKKRTDHPHTVREQYGLGNIYRTSLINKLVCLAVNKLASLDPFGMGIEMEANKPNWFDALNGLPGLFGSSLCETLELKRLIIFIKEALEKIKARKVSLSEEIFNFLIALDKLFTDYLSDNSVEKDYYYWDKSYSLKEEYRYQTKMGLSGKEQEIDAGYLKDILNNALNKIDAGIAKAQDKNGIYYSYFINEVTQYTLLENNFVQPTQFTQKKLPLFLEGQMHALRILPGLKACAKLYQAVKKSLLYDKKLKMYKVTAPLKSAPEEIGRCRAFTPGWLENESIWLHMEYKYLLEILACGLYEEFYADFKNVLIPFQPAARYGRNILENSSFIVSSAFPDKNLHGNGFVARLSGSTAEFLHLWLVMNIGKQPFSLKNNELCLKFEPALAGWLFTKKEGTYAFNFLSKIRLVYHNPKRRNTFGKNGVSPKKILFMDKDEKSVEISCNTIPSPYAQQVRSRQIKRIDVYLE